MAAADRLTPDQLVSEAHKLLPESPLVVALGGGADSAVAAWVAAQRTANPRHLRLVMASTARQRSKKPPAALGTHLGIGVTFVDAPVDAGPSLESRARDARWNAITSAVAGDETW